MGTNGQELAKTQVVSSEAIERVLIGGNLAELSPDQRLSYYNRVCESVGLNPLTKPFEYITLNGKLTLYARKDCTDQLRKLHGVSITIVAREHHDGVYVVTARAQLADGRSDESIGAVSVGGLKGDSMANAVMKAETKAKRRVTLSICGLGMLDETEAETIPGAYSQPASVPEPKTLGEDFQRQVDLAKSVIAKARNLTDLAKLADNLAKHKMVKDAVRAEFIAKKKELAAKVTQDLVQGEFEPREPGDDDAA